MKCCLEESPEGNKRVTIQFDIDKNYYNSATIHTVIDKVMFHIQKKLEVILLDAKQQNGTPTFDGAQ